MLLLDTEEAISENSLHELEEPTPLRSRKLGPPCRANLLSSLPGSSFKLDGFLGLDMVGSTTALLLHSKG